MEALMNLSELKSLSSQVTMGYGCVITRCLERPGWQPLRLALVGLDDAPKTRARLPDVRAMGDTRGGAHAPDRAPAPRSPSRRHRAAAARAMGGARARQIARQIARPAHPRDATAHDPFLPSPRATARARGRREVDQWGVRVHGADFGAAIPALYALPPDAGEPATIDGSRIVVLSPDAPDALREVREDCVYVIGGLCDYKRIANVTCQRASTRGTRAARLPISEALGLGDRVDILTVNQVVVALHDVANGCDWADALRRAMPARKLRDFADGGDGGGGGASSEGALPARGAAPAGEARTSE
jgi:hypothetical protein